MHPLLPNGPHHAPNCPPMPRMEDLARPLFTLDISVSPFPSLYFSLSLLLHLSISSFLYFSVPLLRLSHPLVKSSHAPHYPSLRLSVLHCSSLSLPFPRSHPTAGNPAFSAIAGNKEAKSSARCCIGYESRRDRSFREEGREASTSLRVDQTGQESCNQRGEVNVTRSVMGEQIS